MGLQELFLDSQETRATLDSALQTLRNLASATRAPAAVDADSMGQAFSNHAHEINQIMAELHQRHATAIAHTEAALISAGHTVEEIDAADEAHSQAHDRTAVPSVAHTHVRGMGTTGETR
ncbi:hypothetical protein C1Y63_05190 [Corynebacterium sp. 13CS0277]|uniref:hypothetical protein n=1 Tax=Corynebacterium sp. 13CS0277 TaxID=2071994 RepID=UPI000D027CFA|nr:hypothetical protein [Corynebacterium sp. 13CS0277]PRQ11578.1 hypothetical protein C1Y63_05190 [Corynebacterium sp. 13CS0277]